MKQMKKITSVLLCLLMIFSLFSFISFAEEKKTLSLLSYNVAGLPDFKALVGKGDKDVRKNQQDIGKILNSRNYDVIAVQEDFAYHTSLEKELSSFSYKTYHTGGVPGGDGMNFYSKYPLYNEERTTWNKAYGVLADGADEMTPKGILYCVLDLGDGVLVDFYDIHADAYGDAGSKEARRDNFKQLAQIINARGTDRLVIVTGDFNIYFHALNADDGLYESFVEGCGLKDSWVELHNNGDYKNFADCRKEYGNEAWGVWESVEKFLYRDGGGVSLVPTESEYEFLYSDDKTALSDHATINAVFEITKGEDFKESNISLSVNKPDKFDSFIKKVFLFFTDFFKALAHIDELKDVL